MATSWLLVSAQATWRRQPGWLMVYLWSFFLSFYLYLFIFLSRNWSQPLHIRSPKFFTNSRVMTQGCQRGPWISKILLTYFTGCKKPLKKAFFHVFFTGWPHVFDRCAKMVCARRNPKTTVSSTMNYLSADITLITVVLVVLQITAWENWSNS